MISTEHLTTGAESPFLPGTNIQFAWDSTSLGLIKTCPRLYQYTIIDGWASKHDSIHLTFGIYFHKSLEIFEHHRAEGKSWPEAFEFTVREVMSMTAGWEVDETTKAGKYKNRATLLGLVIDYLDNFQDDPCQTYILDSGKPATELSFRFELDWGPEWQREEYIPELDETAEVTSTPQPYILSGHLDKVVTFNDSLYVLDHKTSTYTLSSTYFKQYEPNNQMTLYTLAGQIVLNAPVKGVIISAAQILLDSPNRFVRGFTYRTQDQIDEWLNDLHIHLRNAEAYAEDNHWPMNDTACDKFGGCRFREVCSKSPHVRENFLRADFIQLAKEDRWNPLKSR